MTQYTYTAPDKIVVELTSLFLSATNLFLLMLYFVAASLCVVVIVGVG